MSVQAAQDTAPPEAVPIQETLAAFVAETDPDQIPEQVRQRAVHHMLDAVGIALASSREDFALRVLTALRGLGETGQVPAIGLPARLPLRDAAMLNGLLCHGLDFDDTHIAAVLHPTASVFPTVMAAAYATGASGREAVTAFVVGVEAATRLGMVARGGFHRAGFHPTSLVGVFGCTLAAGRLFGLTERQLAHAQGIALSLASGSLEFLEDGAWNKRLHPGWAANAGLTAAALAREEFVGISRPYDGRYGLYASYMRDEISEHDLSQATVGLASRWELTDTAIKPFPACHFTHGCIDAALELLRQGINPDRIETIEALVPAEVVDIVCEPEANKKRPANSYDAQFSVPFLVAAAFRRGRFTLSELTSDTLTDPQILALAKRVSYRVDPRSPFPRTYSGELVVTLSGGEVRTHREEVNRGSPQRPLSNVEIVEKYRANAALAVDGRAVERCETALLNLDQAEEARRNFDRLGRSIV